MAEIEALPWNGINVVSTFSGAGGSCLGYRMTGARVLWASEFIPAAQEVYRLNHPTSHLDTRDIREVTPEDILEAIGLESGELDLFDGSPPCASFSQAGVKRKEFGKERSYSGVKQRTDDLFEHYARILAGLQPRAFIVENVPGMLNGKKKGHFKLIIRMLKDCGYRVKGAVVDASWLGVPQRRRRLIFVGFREDLELDPVFPDPLPFRYTVRQALADPPDPLPEGDESDQISIEGYSIAKIASRLRQGEWSERFFNLVRAHMDEVCPTISQTASNVGSAAVIHPLGMRKFATWELRRLCGFPDDFQLVGDYRRRGERLGRAVPPVMMRAIAGRVIEELQARG